MAEGKGILAGIRVIDAATYIAAPACAAALSDFGAEVIKIERPPYGDPHRYLSQVQGQPVSEYPYCWILDGRNKRSIALNLALDDGREVLLKLADAADVFITNYQPQMLDKFRIGYEALHARNPRLIYAQITGYGEVGEEVNKPGYDMTGYWARSGLMDYIYNQGGAPAQSPAGFGDHPTAMALFGGILLALYNRYATGEGMKVSTSLMANGAWSNGCMIQAALCGAEFAPRQSREKPANPLVNHYQSSDDRRFILCLLDPQKDWRAICNAIEHPELLEDPRFRSPALRRENSTALVAVFGEAFRRQNMEWWKQRFQQHEVIWGPVPNSQEVAHDPQFLANGVFPEIAGSGGLRTVANPLNLEGVEKATPRMAPGIGEHTVEILRELGYADTAIRGLEEAGAVVGHE